MVRPLFDIVLSSICRNGLSDQVALLSGEMCERLLEYFASHDLLSSPDCIRILSSKYFGVDLESISFFLSEQLNDEILGIIAQSAKQIHEITIIDCPNVTDQGIAKLTEDQSELIALNLRSMRNLTHNGLRMVRSAILHSVDLSGCFKITSEAIFELVFHNPSIRKLYLNSCRGLDDQALYDIGHYIGENLDSIELDFLPNMLEPAATIRNFSQKCRNISQLSLCRFFEPELPESEYQIEGVGLREVDLYGNYFITLPKLPLTIHTIRLSVSGGEDVNELIRRLQLQPRLRRVELQLECLEEDVVLVEKANTFLCQFLPALGNRITKLQITLFRLNDEAIALATTVLPNLVDLALDIVHINPLYLRRFFSGGIHSRGARLRSLKLSRLRITYRAMFAIGKGARVLTDLEASYMPCVDDRFLLLLAENCKNLRSVNFNGCKWVTDRGIGALARNGSLCEVRIRGTGCTDKSIYGLAEHCPQMEWIAHADFSGRPKFSDAALQCLRDSCLQRVIC